MPRLRIKKSIERIAVVLAQFARGEQWLHLNRQRTQTVGECLIGWNLMSAFVDLKPRMARAKPERPEPGGCRLSRTTTPPISRHDL